MSNTLKIKPIGDQVVLKPIVEDNKTKSGIVIPDTVSKDTPQKGTVVALGTGKVLEDGKRVDFTVKVGDRVIFKKYSPTEFTIEDEDYLIMSESDILGILE